MKKTAAQKIIEQHIVEGKFEKGTEIGLRIDQTLTQDATGTMAYLQFEAMGVPKVKTRLAVSYVDHNTLQSGFMNADDHAFLQSIAAKYGLYFSRPGNGICHQVNLERFGRPGWTMLGSDSHTPTGGGIGMIAIGAGGLDVATAMAGLPYYINVPEIVGVELTGNLRSHVNAKDVILELLRRLSVKGGVGKIMEYYGPGVKSLTVPERATITNMGAELGATTSVFPSDPVTRAFLKAQGRAGHYKEIKADKGAAYDQVIKLNLNRVIPAAACPHMPDNVKSIRALKGKPVDQVIIGSCTNSSYRDLMLAAGILKGKKVAPNVSLGIAPGSRQVLSMIAANGALKSIIDSGARVLESACGPCIGMGQSPKTEGVTLRTFNRNFKGRSGTKSGQAYLVSPETAACSAIKGSFTDPTTMGKKVKVTIPRKFTVDDSMILPPAKKGSRVKIVRGPNIVKLPDFGKPGNNFTGKVVIKTGDNITTDHIMPAGAKILPLRSNIPAISEFVFSQVDPDFPDRAKATKNGIIIGGVNYGQGSSREHAALAPRYLGIQAVICKSFARIHWNNLINFGILPLTLTKASDYAVLNAGDTLEFSNVLKGIDNGVLTIINKKRKKKVEVSLEVSARQKEILKAGGLLNLIKAGK